MKSLPIRVRVYLMRKSIERWGLHIGKSAVSATQDEMLVLMQE